MAELTDFGKAVKIRLIEIGQNQEWLIARVREKTGLYLDSGYMWKIFTGKNQADKIVCAIKEILDIKEDT